MKTVAFLVLLIGCFACKSETKGDKNNNSSVCVNPNAEFFYPICDSARFYVYRNMVNGLNEEFHRVYKVEDSKGPHVVVERYASDGRLLEALNYNIDSLDLIDHMVVNLRKEKEQAILYKNKLFPFDINKEINFASKFRGVNDSTVILKEIIRKFSKKTQMLYLQRKLETLIFKDYICLTNLNIYERKEEERIGEEVVYFAKGLGLTEWHSPTKSVHFKLEKVISQKQWVQLMQQ
jgi:hypothetical protein